MAGIAYFQFIIWAAFSSLRAYALCRQRVLSVFIFLLLLAPAMINYVVQYIYGITGEWDPTLGCISETNLTRKLARKLVISSRTCIITADTLLVGVTVWTLARRGVVSNMLSSSRGNLSSVMLYDGLLYFVLLLILNVLHLAFTVSAVFGNVLSNISIFTDEVIAVLVSHFILDLQEANRRTLKLGTDDPLNFTATWSLQDHALGRCAWWSGCDEHA